MAVVAAVLLFAAPAGWAAETPSLALVRPGSPWLPPGDEATSSSEADPPAAAPSDAGSRATKRGMKIGAIAGAVTGAVLLPFALAFGEGLCDAADCPDYELGNYVVAGVAGAALFGVAGAGIGALIGSAFRGTGASPEPTATTPPPAPSSPKSAFGSLALTAGVNSLTEAEYTSGSTTGLALTGSLLANFAEGRLSAGVESGYSWLANGLFELGGVVRFVLTDTGLRPYGVFGLGWDNWAAAPYTYPPVPPSPEVPGAGGASLFGAGIGAGLSFPIGGRSSIELESRYSWPLQTIDEPGDFKYVSVTFGPRLSW
jgi:hypothetical protein